jgi:hypothetical protein
MPSIVDETDKGMRLRFFKAPAALLDAITLLRRLRRISACASVWLKDEAEKQHFICAAACTFSVATYWCGEFSFCCICTISIGKTDSHIANMKEEKKQPATIK